MYQDKGGNEDIGNQKQKNRRTEYFDGFLFFKMNQGKTIRCLML